MRAPDCLDGPVYEPDEEHATADVLNAKERMDPAWRMQTAVAALVRCARCYCKACVMTEVQRVEEKRRNELTLPARLGRRDKRGSPVEPQAIGMAWVLACRSVGARAAPCILTNAIKGLFGTVCAFDRGER
ncbi:hypothetical protein BSZ21_00970 [Bradyrhizobium canariense]|nr:hypothetical protein BSZ21_00970 [Bradyrhizobium canariense]